MLIGVGKVAQQMGLKGPHGGRRELTPPSSGLYHGLCLHRNNVKKKKIQKKNTITVLFWRASFWGPGELFRVAAAGQLGEMMVSI